MHEYAPCLIKLDRDHTPRFISAAREVLAPPWYHHPSKVDTGEFIHFRRDAIPGSPAVILSLFREDSETLRVSNVIPEEGSISIAQWRAILLDFDSGVLDKIRAHALHFVTFMGTEDLNLADTMRPVACGLLQSFARLAPKERNVLHPCDHIHFLQFIAALHTTGHRLSPHCLGAWLREQGFNLELSAMLEYEFDYHLQLLKIYDGILKSRDAAVAKQA